MGSTSCHRPKGITHKDFFQQSYGDKLTILEASQARGGAVYMAVRHETDGNTHKAGDVFAVVVLTGWSPKSYYNFWFKDMDETMGPNESECPRKILDLLSPLDDLYGPPFIGPLKQYQSRPGQYARDWRARCEDRLARRAAAPKVRKGTRIRLPEPLRFTNGAEYQTFTYTGKGVQFEVEGAVNAYGYPLVVRIRKWRDRQFEVLDAAEAMDSAYAV
jgi:hypothetical protein